MKIFARVPTQIRDTLVQAHHVVHSHLMLLATGSAPWDGVNMSSTGIPGAAQAQGIVGGLMFWVGILLDAGAVIGIAFLVLSSRSSHLKSANEGHRWVGAAVVGAILLGSITTFLGWGYGVGQGITG